MLKYHIQTIEVGAAGAAEITFNNIPQDYDDLYLVSSVRTNRAAPDEVMDLVFNGADTNRTSRNLRAEVPNVASSSLTNLGDGWATAANTTANTFGSISYHIPNYRSNAAKSYSIDSVTENNATYAVLALIAGLWSSTAAVNSLTIKSENNSTLVQYSSASLYGIKRGSDGVTGVLPAAQGGIVTTSGGYTIHTFQSSSTFVANRSLDAEVLVVAGGGGGGNGNGGGGGGAGGVVQTTTAVSSGSYPVFIGAGGGTAADGNNTTFASVVALKGGRGGSALSLGTTQNDGAGQVNLHGSGGGVARERITVGVGGGAGTPGQGNNGGNSDAGGYTAGGGGGAGAVGQNALTDENRNAPGGDGGAGIQSSISGTALYYGGGGGACGYQTVRNPAGGSGVGGQGSMRDTGSTGATAGAANRGGGGGGGGTGAFKSPGQAGGSGVVIIRYLTPA